jgi:hypothetical protein
MTAGSRTLARRPGRADRLIGLVAPLLDIVLLVGDRVSRLVPTDDRDYVPARMAPEGESAPRGIGDPARRRR